MKVLWVLNMMLPDAAKALNKGTTTSGTWLLDYVNSIKADEEIELATMTYAGVDKLEVVTVDRIKHYVFPGGGKRLLISSKKTLADCRYVLDDFKPDLIHLHGTEYSMARAMVDIQPIQPVLLTIQGILTRISQEFKAGLTTREFLSAATLKQWLTLKAPIFTHQLYLKNAKRERYVLQHVKRVTGRVDWDKAVMLSINPNLQYDRLNYNVPPVFYDAEKWQISKAEPHSIYTGASKYPLKGLHMLIRALALVKLKYPDVRLYVPGNSTSYQKSNGYERYLHKLINKLGLAENVEFVGRKSSAEIVELLQKSRICVLPSAMEGASATLREAMMIGTPSICSFRGGMVDLIQDGHSGFCYDFNEYPVLADRICRLIEDDALCCKFSKNAIENAEQRHARQENYQALKNIYREMLAEK
ncbi:MAG: glycosyltransferase family 4 protein [Oscillospiraceae bacterium]|nr:glycosyltransferase family 4 protein [Oscillospiraceae bacterium]